MSLFVPVSKSPLSYKDGGNGWFSWLKKSSKSAPLMSHPMYSRENRFESDCANFIFEIALLIVLDVFIVAKRANLFWWIGECIGVTWSTSLSLTNWSNCCFPMFSIKWILSMTLSLARRHVSIANSLSSWFENGFPYWNNVSISCLRFVLNFCWKLWFDLFWIELMIVFIVINHCYDLWSCNHQQNIHFFPVCSYYLTVLRLCCIKLKHCWFYCGNKCLLAIALNLKYEINTVNNGKSVSKQASK